MLALTDSPLNDRWLFHYVYPLTAIAVVHIGNENSLAHLLTVPSYYSDLLLAFTLSFGVGAYYHWWYKTHFLPVSRGNGQLSTLLSYLGEVVLVPVGTIVGIELAYVTLLLDIPLADISIFYLELPLILLCCVLVNLVYVMLNYRAKYHSAQINPSGSDVAMHNPTFQVNFVVHEGVKSKNIPVKEVAYFQVESKLTFLITHDGCRFLYATPLKELEKDLDPDQFFYLSRQVVAHRSSIVGYQRTDTRKLEVELSPASLQPVFVSKAKAGHFLKWMEGKLMEVPA